MNEELDKILKENEELKKENALLKEKLKSLQINLEFDSLTGVYNKKTFKDFLALILTVGVILIIVFVLWQIPFTRNYLIGLYNDTPAVQFIVNLFLNIFK